MKTKKVVKIIGIISIILICNTIKSYAWLAESTFEAYNIINVLISNLLKLMAFIITIIFITLTIKYIKNPEIEQKQKNKNIRKWLIITIMQIIILLVGAFWVKEIGIETYWTSGERYQFNEIDGYISNAIRISALFLIIFYTLKSIVYWVQSEKEEDKKIINIAKWQMITIVIIGGLLILATNW